MRTRYSLVWNFKSWYYYYYPDVARNRKILIWLSQSHESLPGSWNKRIVKYLLNLAELIRPKRLDMTLIYLEAESTERLVEFLSKSQEQYTLTNTLTKHKELFNDLWFWYISSQCFTIGWIVVSSSPSDHIPYSWLSLNRLMMRQSMIVQPMTPCQCLQL